MKCNPCHPQARIEQRQHPLTLASRSSWHELARAMDVLDFGQSALLGLNDKGQIVYRNRGADAVFPPLAHPGKRHAWGYLLRESHQGEISQRMHDMTGDPVSNTLPVKAGSLFARRSDQPERPLEGSLSHFMVDGQDGFLLMLNDISARLANEERLIYLAQHDPLTELPNRALFMDRLEAAIRRHARAGSTFALIFVDLDGFKHVNDAFGHQYGDQMLRACGERLRACVRESDSAARLGGDEFAVLFEPINSLQEARNTVGRIGRCLQQEPVMIGDKVDVLRPSIGLAIYPQDGNTPSALLRVADLAMYQAKKSAALAVTEGVEVRRHTETVTDADGGIAQQRESK